DGAFVVQEFFTYTPEDRLLDHKHKIRNRADELLSHNEYDALGQLVAKNVGGTFGGVPIQRVNYSYNIRGWLKDINNVENLEETSVADDLFAFKINYDQAEMNAGNQVAPLFNGNISETFWRSGSDNILRNYGYQYDDLNRLRKGFYHRDFDENNATPTSSFNEEISYDKNGNIKTMWRTGDLDSQNQTIVIDDLVYDYDDASNPNQLLKVHDQEAHPSGFKDDQVVDNDPDYTYDDFGNMKSDQNKGITNITYNHLNLPLEIIFNGDTTTKINYLYDAAGSKIRKTVTTEVSLTLTIASMATSTKTI
ncbi:MAG TPA: hypothetical protein VF676_02645, partial [Flavobacterium sp.]